MVVVVGVVGVMVAVGGGPMVQTHRVHGADLVQRIVQTGGCRSGGSGHRRGGGMVMQTRL